MQQGTVKFFNETFMVKMTNDLVVKYEENQEFIYDIYKKGCCAINT